MLDARYRCLPLQSKHSKSFGQGNNFRTCHLLAINRRITALSLLRELEPLRTLETWQEHWQSMSRQTNCQRFGSTTFDIHAPPCCYPRARTLTIMQTLDHSEITLTLNTCAHVVPALQRDAADKMQSILQ